MPRMSRPVYLSYPGHGWGDDGRSCDCGKWTDLVGGSVYDRRDAHQAHILDLPETRELLERLEELLKRLKLQGRWSSA
jgi:hypothetical protein